MEGRGRTKINRMNWYGLWAGCAAVGLGLIISGCGSGGEGTGGTASGTPGQVLVFLTDAEGDFLSYVVGVESISLTRRDGTLVETVPLSTRIDFAEYVEMTEFFTAATIPSGTYVSAQMRLDYSTAMIQVEDANGNAVSVPVGNIKDGAGNPVTIMDFRVKFDDRRALVVAPGVPAHLTLDFNLGASNRVDFTTNPPSVTVEPFLVADVESEEPKTHRLRGPLRSVNERIGTYQVLLRPVHRLLGEFGGMTVHTDADTVFEINQVNYRGAAGLAALAAMPTGTATVAVGKWLVDARQFYAQEVLAGSSVPGGTHDVVTGNVTARTGDQLTVRGASLVRADGTFTFHDTFTLLVGTGTKVKKQAVVTTGLDKDDVSVGQRIAAYGSLNATTNTIDATGGLVRMQVTSVSGNVNSVAAGSLQMSVQRINRRRISLFNFAGTGATPANDADPARYEVATGPLTLSGVGAGAPVWLLGFPARFKTAPPDFTAQTLVDLTNHPATMLIGWRPATAAPIVVNSASGLTLNLTGSGPWHHVWRGSVATDLAGFGSSPVASPEDPDRGLFALGSDGRVEMFAQFEKFRLAVEQHLLGGEKAALFGSHGSFSDEAVTMTARRMYTAFHN